MTVSLAWPITQPYSVSGWSRGCTWPSMLTARELVYDDDSTDSPLYTPLHRLPRLFTSFIPIGRLPCLVPRPSFCSSVMLMVVGASGSIYHYTSSVRSRPVRHSPSTHLRIAISLPEVGASASSLLVPLAHHRVLVPGASLLHSLEQAAHVDVFVVPHEVLEADPERAIIRIFSAWVIAQLVPANMSRQPTQHISYLMRRVQFLVSLSLQSPFHSWLPHGLRSCSSWWPSTSSTRSME